MLDEQSTVGQACKIHEEAEVTESVLADEVVVAKGTTVLHTELGKKVMLGKNNNIVYSKMGKYCYTGNNTYILNATLGKFNAISWNVSIGGNDHELNHVTTHSFLVYEKWGMGGHSNWASVSKPCQIGNDVWIASGANIFRNVTIGYGAVIGGSAVVTKDVPPYAIVVGNPARILRYRCKEEMIEKLLLLKWWDFPEEVIKANFDLFHAELTEEILDKLFEIKNNL